MPIAVNTLMEEAKCYTCLGISQAEALELALLNRIVSGSGGTPVVPAVSYYTITGLSPSAGAPGDGITYFFGADISAAGNSINGMVTYAVSRTRIPVAGIITGFWVNVRVRTVLGSNELVSHSIRLNDTTDLGATTASYDAATVEITSPAINQAVAVGDFIALKVVCPTWVATNPTGVTWYFYVTIQVPG